MIIKQLFENLFESEIDSVKTDLEKIGYKDFIQKSKKTLVVLTDKSRMQVIGDIISKIPSTEHDPTPSSKSSIGIIKDSRGIEIIVKPKGKQGRKSAGVENEDMLVEQINQHASLENPIKIIFSSPTKNYQIDNVIEAKSVGISTSNRKKADVVIITKDHTQYNISLKKDNAEYWESADSFWGKKAGEIIENLVKKGKIQLKKHQEGYYTITPNIAVKATPEETLQVVFGSDILGQGAVITRTFTPNDFNFDDDTLTIKCSNIIENLDDIPDDKQVWFLIRNDKTRSGYYKGIRVLATYKKRINPNVLQIER